MARTLAALLRRLDSVAPDPAADAALLRRYATSGDRDALAALVHRHGPVVYGVCRRLLRPDEVEDGFQATFLVLARRAGAVRKAGSVGSWLVGVAGRVAREVRRAERRRARREAPLADEGGAAPEVGEAGPERTELARLLHEELARLPDRLRGPVVACLLEGRTSDEAAAELGSSPRTVRRRVEQAKLVLRARLERRGVAPAVAAGLVAQVGVVTAAVPAELVRRSADGVCGFLSGGTSPPGRLADGVTLAMSTRPALTLVGVTVACAGAVGITLALRQPPGELTPRPPVASAVLPVVPPGRREPVYYYPTRVGDRLTYRYPTGDETHVVTAVERKGDTRAVSVGKVEGDEKVSPRKKVEVSAEGVFVIQGVTYHPRVTGFGQLTTDAVYGNLDEPHCLLKLPAAPGLRWSAPFEAGFRAWSTARAEESVRVPAGEFKAIPVDWVIDDEANPRKPRRFWYAPGVGAVKLEDEEGGFVLQSFHPGKG